jgi:hypothetical protein
MSSVAEKFTISCPQCGEKVAVSRAHVGKKGRCGKCQTVFTISAPETAAPQDDELQLRANDDDLVPTASTASPFATKTNNPMAHYANDYMQKAKEYKGGTIQQIEENDAQYRFMTSWGSVIGGSITIAFFSLLAFILLVGFGSIRLTVGCIVVVMIGIGWLIQGLNYVTYYRWKDQGGRDQ